MKMMGMTQGSLGCPMDKSSNQGHATGMGSSMRDMVESLSNKKGDDFDRAFIEGMIIHHEGAVEMAEQAKKKAKHDEIKKLADEIITAQTREIRMMKDWKNSWGY